MKYVPELEKSNARLKELFDKLITLVDHQTQILSSISQCFEDMAKHSYNVQVYMSSEY